MITEREKWNRVSGDYQSVFKLGINEYNTSLLQFLAENGMLMPGCRVIDIGCGVGKYGTYLAGLGCDVTLTDISDKMIQSAKENMAPLKLHGRPFAAISTTSPAVRRLSPKDLTLPYLQCRLPFMMSAPCVK